MKKRLLVVDDQVMLLDVLERQFADDPDLELVGLAKEAATVARLVRSLQPDILMLDVDLGGTVSGFDVLSAMRPLVPRIVMVSMFENAMYRNRAFALAADAYATKGVRFATLRALLLDDTSYAVPESDRGRFWRNSPEASPGELAARFPSLSERERAVVVAIAGGAMEKEIADRFGISVSATSTYLRRAMEKLGIKTRAELLHKRIVLER